MPPSTSSSLTILPPEDTFMVSLADETYYQCSRHACCEYCQSHSTRGHVSVGRPSILWPLSVALMIWLWTWTSLTFESSHSTLTERKYVIE